MFATKAKASTEKVVSLNVGVYTTTTFRGEVVRSTAPGDNLQTIHATGDSKSRVASRYSWDTTLVEAENNRLSVNQVKPLLTSRRLVSVLNINSRNNSSTDIRLLLPFLIEAGRNVLPDFNNSRFLLNFYLTVQYMYCFGEVKTIYLP